MLRVIMFNWPIYACAFAIAALAFIWQPVFGIVVLIFIFMSLGASFWVYDLSSLRNTDWLRDLVSAPASILNVTAGYDESTAKLSDTFPNAEISIVDFLSALGTRTGSIERASKYFPGTKPVVAKTLSSWPMPELGYELVLLWFAAHEVRAADMRDELFRECKRVVSANGSIVLVEHLRDAANFAAYGPGAMHFMAESEWQRCIAESGLQIKKQFRITPFVKVFVVCR
jgi:hypothetical protein